MAQLLVPTSDMAGASRFGLAACSWVPTVTFFARRHRIHNDLRQQTAARLSRNRATAAVFAPKEGLGIRPTLGAVPMGVQ